MPKIYFSRIGRFGNNLIQYFMTIIFNEVFGHELVQYSSMCKNAYEIHDNDPLFEAFREFLLNNPKGTDILKSHPFAKRDIILHGFFQQSDLLLLFRPEILRRMTTTNTDSISHGILVSDVVNTKGLANPSEIVIHVRLDDFQEEKETHILHPRVYLQTLRKLSSPLRIVSEPPKTFAEELYFSIFESLHPIFQRKSLLEDFATLRDASVLFSSNSTFSWCAAFLGQQKRYLPLFNSFTLQNLGAIEETDIHLDTTYLSLDMYKKPKQFLPLAGEHIQSLCDIIILNKEKYIYHKYLDRFVPPEKYLFLEDEWKPLEVERVFLYQELVEESLQKICSYFTGIRLLVIHNGDPTISLNTFANFFNRFPQAHIFLQNNIHDHPNIHSLPMGVQNKMWRNRETWLHYEEKAPINEKNNLAICSWFGTTHPVRKVLREYLEMNPFDGLHLVKKVSPEIYEGYLQKSIFSFCPPGNAFDTHRLWESLFARSIPIVLREPFIEQLQKHFPSIPFIVVDSFVQVPYKELLEQKKKTMNSIPLPFCCLFEYWKLLFQTFSCS
jgi:hypothetical protein